MRLNRCLSALALLAFLPARADEAGAKAPEASAKPAEQKAQKMSCCAGEEGADKALCPKGKEMKKEKTAAKKSTARPAAAPAAKPVAAASASAPATGAANMVVTRDPVTGEIRNATPEERAKLLAGRTPQASTVAPQVVVLPDGTEMVRLGEESMNYSVATVAPDGTIQQSCVHGADAAADARKAKAAAPASAPRAEER